MVTISASVSFAAGVVGVVSLTGALSAFSETVLVQADAAEAGSLRFIYAVANHATDVAEITELIAATIRVEQSRQIAIETSEGIIALQNMISGQLGASARQLTAIILSVGIAVVGVTMLGMVSAKRRDFGRRRALGASRSSIMVLVLVQAGLAAVVGATLGTAAGAAVIAATTDALPTTPYMIGLAILATLAALIGAMPPAILAANRDPVRILRVP